MKHVRIFAILIVCLTSATHAALVVFPNITVTSIGQPPGTSVDEAGVSYRANFPGDPDPDAYGTYTVADNTNQVFSPGDTLELTIQAAPGHRFRIAPDPGIASFNPFGLSLAFGAQLNLGTDRPASAPSLTFNGLTGLEPTAEDVFVVTRQGGFGPPDILYFIFDYGDPTADVPAPIEFDSITLTAIVDPTTTLTMDPNPAVFEMGASGMSMVPIPEPSTAAFFTGAAVFALAFSRRRSHKNQ